MKKINLVIALFGMLLMVSCGGTTTDETTTSDEMITVSLKVSGNCGMCKTRIENATTSLEGVATAVWAKNTKQLDVSYSNTVNLQEIHQAIADAGHDTDLQKTTDENYNKLPNCCKYRDGNPHEGHDH